MIKAQNSKTIRTIIIPALDDVSSGTVSLMFDQEENRYYIERKAVRSKIKTLVDKYEFAKEDNEVEMRLIDNDFGNKILDRIVSLNYSYNSCFVFYEKDESAIKTLDWVKSDEEHRYTSTGIKFWRHQTQMFEFLKPSDGSPRSTVISTHISPEGACNLKCPYCSVTYRDTHARIPLPRIKQYVEDLIKRGLKAVILTGGGEPTLYPHFNELVQWIKKEKGLNVALITNGTNTKRIQPETFSCFSWIRVSINIFPGWTEKISLPTADLSSDCVVGCSMVYTAEHEASQEFEVNRYDLFKKVSKVADSCGASYVRLLPNCLLEQKQLIQQHISLKQTLENYDDKRFFQQYKIHGAPCTSKCHQAYFRPYLSEEPFAEDGIPGSVYPCDSVVLNDTLTHFAKSYQLCKPENVLDFIDGKIDQKFDPKVSCAGCVFTDNVNMLEQWKNTQQGKFENFTEKILHEEFV
jgi:organic radical activating enzyme